MTARRTTPHAIGSITASRYSREHDQVNHNIAISARKYLRKAQKPKSRCSHAASAELDFRE
jgi:hypothetical protein